MIDKSVIQKIMDDFIEKISSDPIIGKEIGESMRKIITSETFEKEDIIKALKGDVYEDS
jgi:hypothetical protein